MIMRPNWRKKRGHPKKRLRFIIEALEDAPGTFEELCRRVPLARTTISDGLNELESQGRIERKVEPPKERGRGKRHRAIISLSGKELDPVMRALRHLEKVTAAPLIDIERGKEILPDEVIDAIFVVPTLYPKTTEAPNTPKCPHPASWGCHWESEVVEMKLAKYCDESIKVEFELECYLLKALARYDYERYRAGCVEYVGNASDLLKIGFQEWLKRGAKIVMKEISNPEAFPVLGVVRKYGVTEKFDALLKWISPLVNLRSEDTFMKKPNGQYIIKWIVAPPSEGTRTPGIRGAVMLDGRLGINILHDGAMLRCEIKNPKADLDQLSKVLARADLNTEGSYELKLDTSNNLASAVFSNEQANYHRILSSVRGRIVLLGPGRQKWTQEEMENVEKFYKEHPIEKSHPTPPRARRA